MAGSDSQCATQNGKLQDKDLVIHMTGKETAALVDSVQTWRYRVDSRQHGFFLAKRQRKTSLPAHSARQESHDNDSHTDEVLLDSQTIYTGDSLDYYWVVGSLIEYEKGFFTAVNASDRYICFADPSTYVSYPGWMLRNLLVLIRRRWKLDRTQILCYRDTQGRRDEARSIILSLVAGEYEPDSSPLDDTTHILANMPKVTGWERSSSGKIMSRVANLGEFMDPRR